MAAVHIDKVKDTHLITFLFEQTANVTDDFALWVKHHERGVALHSVGLAKKPCLTCTRTAADQNIQVSAVLLSVQADTHILREQFVLERVFISVLLVESTCIAPFCRAVFLPPAVVPACGEIDADAHSVGKQKNKDSLYAVLTHRYGKRVIYCYG